MTKKAEATSNRYIPYGYRIRGGSLCVNGEEAAAVGEVFRLYEEGRSYKSISETLNSGSYPAYSANGWNKHHIKRILENRRYTGTDGYPAILTREQFDGARIVHDEKLIPNAPNAGPNDILWDCLRCGVCGGKLIRFGIPGQHPGDIRLRCASGCGYTCKIPLAAMHGGVLALLNRLIAGVRECSCGRYEQTPEALRLANAISRGIAGADAPEETAGIILAGISARYAGIIEPPRLPPVLQYGDETRLSEPDWDLFRGAVSHISLARDGLGLTTLSGTEFFMERISENEGTICGT